MANYEGERLLPDCLASLAEQTLRPDEVVVVDAGSSDRSRDVAARFGARFLPVENRGVGPSYNAGVRVARGEYLLLANNDVAFEPDCLERLVEPLAGEERRFAADPCQSDWGGSRVVHARSLLRTAPLFRRPLPGFEIDQTVVAETTTPTLLANGAAMLVRRDLLERLGGFDESFFMEFEELDLCWRAWSRGWETVYVPDARLRHRVGGSTTPDVVRRRLTSAHHNLVRFTLKCLPRGTAARVLAAELLRLPVHPILIGPALVRALAEAREIAAARRAIRPSHALLDWFLGGQNGPAPPPSADAS